MKNTEHKMGHAVLDMLLHARAYSRAYRQQFDSPVGDDQVLGQDMRSILQGLMGLLNGPLGGLDGGTLWSQIHTAAGDMGLLDENGEL